jgi:hypothetical protein
MVEKLTRCVREQVTCNVRFGLSSMSLDAPNSRGSALGPAPVNLGANTSLPWTTGQVKKVNLVFLEIAGHGCRTYKNGTSQYPSGRRESGEALIKQELASRVLPT